MRVKCSLAVCFECPVTSLDTWLFESPGALVGGGRLLEVGLSEQSEDPR